MKKSLKYAVPSRKKSRLSASPDPVSRLQGLLTHFQAAWQRFGIAAQGRLFGRIYMTSALVVLGTSSALWSILSARIQLSNADQLVDPYLFEKARTFHDAVLPGNHSFLLKWPLFWLVKQLGYSSSAYIGVTVGAVLLTVALFAYILYRIERRPLVFGTICLGLASVMLMVPTLAGPGTLLPVNMAMLETRNLEYIMFILALIGITRPRRVRSRSFWGGTALLALLGATDKLFLWMALGGAILSAVLYGLSTGWNLVSTAARWTLSALFAAAGATALLWFINFKSVTHIQLQNGVGPYGFVSSLHQLALGSAYGLLHILTNFGANPATGVTVLRDVPGAVIGQLLFWAGPIYVLNALLLAGGLFAAFQIVRHSLAHNKDKNLWINHPAKLAIALLWSSVAATLVFVGTTHYYAADARYLGLTMFGLFVAGTTYVSRREWDSRQLSIAGLLLFTGMLVALPNVIGQYYQDREAFASSDQLNGRVVAALRQHPVSTLVGDYWRVIPIKYASRNTVSVTPLADCTTPRTTLSSTDWAPDLRTHSFAYLFSFDKGLTDFPVCSVDQVIGVYGRPNATVLIKGTIGHPHEMVFFYDKGVHKSAPSRNLKTVSTVLPIELEDLTSTTCKNPITMNIVAHQDDDLLFMNPDLSAAIAAGNCIRTIYMTSGDAGSGALYWLGREQGSQAAYSKMLGFKDIWVQRVIHLGGNHYVTMANPRGNPKIFLIYMHLPDGGVRGQGFAAHHSESLARLEAGQIPSIHDVYNGSSYTADQLESTLVNLMHTFQPSDINTLANVVNSRYPDHSDHMAVGRIVQKAYHQYENEHFNSETTIPLKFYVGYPIHSMPVNLKGPELTAKEDVFAEYGKYDPAVCHTVLACRRDPAYGAYLPRQYQSPY